MTEYKNILIVRTDRIGDIILTLPLAGIIKKFYPESKVSFLVQSYTAPLLNNHPDIDEVLILSGENGKADNKQNREMLKKLQFDVAITVHPKFQIAKLVYRAGIKTRIGTGYRLYSFLFNKRIYEHRRDAKRHELEYNVNLLKMIGINYDANPSNVHFNVHIDKNQKSWVKNLLEQKNFNFDRKTAIIHPGSGGSAIDWPISRYKSLVNLLAQHLKINIIITGSASEEEICGKVAGNSGAINLAGKVSLKELPALLDIADVMVSNSTGPLHIAAALGKNVIGFYPKITECLPQRWGPYSTRKNIFMPNIECDNCSKEQCAKLNCMDSISELKVLETIKDILNVDR